MTIFEHRSQKLLPLPQFVRRMAVFVGFSAVLVAAALFIGVAGYHWIAGFGWVDSILNASMILGGMGPVGELHTNAAKLFASAYALFSGLVFIAAMGVVLAPVFHRIIHKFHVESEKEE